MKVFLIGYMGSGKSTLGSQLAERLDWRFVDLDTEIEDRLQMSIEDIFSQKGEAHFREVESSVLREFDDEKDLILSTGGGTPCNADNMEWMKEQGFTVWLEATFEQVVDRLEGASNRPLWSAMESEDKRRSHFNQRAEIYSQSQWRFPGDWKEEDIKDLASHIRKLDQSR